LEEFVEYGVVALHVDRDTFFSIQDPSLQMQFGCNAIDEGTKSDTLHDSANFDKPGAGHGFTKYGFVANSTSIQFNDT
jgi:hypothetical protein